MVQIIKLVAFMEIAVSFYYFWILITNPLQFVEQMFGRPFSLIVSTENINSEEPMIQVVKWAATQFTMYCCGTLAATSFMFFPLLWQKKPIFSVWNALSMFSMLNCSVQMYSILQYSNFQQFNSSAAVFWSIQMVHSIILRLLVWQYIPSQPHASQKRSDSTNNNIEIGSKWIGVKNFAIRVLMTLLLFATFFLVFGIWQDPLQFLTDKWGNDFMLKIFASKEASAFVQLFQYSVTSQIIAFLPLALQILLDKNPTQNASGELKLMTSVICLSGLADNYGYYLARSFLSQMDQQVMKQTQLLAGLQYVVLFFIAFGLTTEKKRNQSSQMAVAQQQNVATVTTTKMTKRKQTKHWIRVSHFEKASKRFNF